MASRNSVLGKVAFFLLLAVAFAYVAGAATGWVMIERSQREEWRRQASTNAQIASSAIRSIYTFVSVELTSLGQIERIVSDQMIGNDQSVLDTGYVAIDVLALAALQTKERVWLMTYEPNAGQMVTLSDSDGGPEGLKLHLEQVDDENLNSFATGFATVGDERYYIALLPISTSEGQLLGAIAASAGKADRLLETQSIFYRNSLLYGAIILMATGAAIVLVMRRLFHPIPKLIEALKRIARDETGHVTPFQYRRDEVGQLATAIETLREGVVEREHLRKVREAARELEHLAHHDPLTGLPNRAHLQKTLNQMLEDIAMSGRAINVMLLDLDRFKPVNDTYGHAVGDQVLVATCKRITPLLGPDDVLARLGGDEFALIQAVSGNARKDAQRLGNRIIEAVVRPFPIGDTSISIGISIGVSMAPAHGHVAEDVMGSADVALYTSKGAGRGCLRIYEPGMTMASSGRSTVELELLHALSEEQFELHYQPIVSATDSRTYGYEALLRWRHPRRGLIPPDRFVPVAEETGMIVELDRWVMKQACRQIAEQGDRMTVAVNLSALGLLRKDLPEFVRLTLEETGLSPDRLEIEITESHRIADTDAVSILNAIRAMGIGIAIDDFGTGFSSLSYLMDLPVTRIKLDRRFVSGVTHNMRCLNVVRSAASLARSIGIEVTAEGIEHEAQLDVIRSLGCQSAQGYLFGKPQPLPAPQDVRTTRHPARIAM